MRFFMAKGIHIGTHESGDFESGWTLRLTLPALLAVQSRKSTACPQFEVTVFFRCQVQILHDRKVLPYLLII
jgi:hypothetical protein